MTMPNFSLVSSPVERTSNAHLGDSQCERRALRIAYLAGPGNAFAVARNFVSGKEDHITSHVAYSELFLRACQSVGARPLMLTTNPSEQRLACDGLDVRHITDDFARKRGAAFHVASFRMTWSLRPLLREWRPDVIVLGDDPPRAIAAELLRIPGVSLIRVHHCSLWPSLQGPNVVHRALLRADRRMLKDGFSALLSASSTVSAQLETVAHGRTAPILEFLPHYRNDHYVDVAAADPDARVFRVGFIGRIEENKGVFSLLEIAERLRHRDDIAFDVCGDGSGMPLLQERVAQAGLGNKFILHGFCNRPQLVSVLSRVHLGCIPTRIIEGMNQAAVEFVLAGRPIVASRTIPAVDYLGRAVKLAKPDDPASYATAIASVADDRSEYMALRDGCTSARAKFLRFDTSYGAALESVFSAIAEGRTIQSRRIGFDGNAK